MEQPEAAHSGLRLLTAARREAYETAGGCIRNKNEHTRPHSGLRLLTAARREAYGTAGGGLTADSACLQPRGGKLMEQPEAVFATRTNTRGLHYSYATSCLTADSACLQPQSRKLMEQPEAAHSGLCLLTAGGCGDGPQRTPPAYSRRAGSLWNSRRLRRLPTADSACLQPRGGKLMKQPEAAAVHDDA
ncbi:MAG: hypothetical protein LBD24_00825 [Spirochaetaceae bacterium]|jgi:hypothetical protein|nr:hypothetical protein [Spirochaetaceae bacterium]